MGYMLWAVRTICSFEVFCTAVVSIIRRLTCRRGRVTVWTTPNAKMSSLPVKFASALPAFQAAREAILGESGSHCRKKINFQSKLGENCHRSPWGGQPV